MADKKKAKAPPAGREPMSEEEMLARANRRRWKWKSTIRFVIRNLYWLSDMEDIELGDDVQKNIMLLTRKKEKRTSLLSLQDKALLNKRAEWRTEDEQIHLARILAGLKCFRRYPGYVKEQLAAATYYYYYPSGKVIVRQGHQSYSLYFIVTGDVVVSQSVLDPVLNKMETKELAIIGPGSMFGEVSLLHGIPRTATITTLAHCEFLCLRQREFETILKATVQKEWDTVKADMKLFSYFDEWDEIAVRECCILSRTKKYRPDQTILGDGCGRKDLVYFILRGQCRIIEHLLVTTVTRCGKKYYKAYNPEAIQQAEVEPDGTKSREALLKSREALLAEKRSAPVVNLTAKPVPKVSNIDLPPGVETHFMQVCFLNATGCFGIGENMKRRRVVAVTAVECLLVPRYWLLERNQGNIWGRIRQFLNKHIPTSRQVFKEFVGQRRWLAHKRDITSNIVSQRKIPNDNDVTNLPYCIRLTESTEDK